jgi:hypothetical protein
MLILGIIGCGGRNVRSADSQKAKLKTGSIAVICGTVDQKDLRLADEISRQLKKETSFKVISQEEISQKIPQYPMHFIESQPSNTDRWSISTSQLSEENIQRLNKVQKILKADYIFLVWDSELTTTYGDETCCFDWTGFLGGNKCQLYVPVRVVQYPAKEVAAFKNYTRTDTYSVFKPLNSAIDSLIVDTASIVTKWFVQNTEEGQLKKANSTR